jgi:hypothetical protein
MRESIRFFFFFSHSAPVTAVSCPAVAQWAGSPWHNTKQGMKKREAAGRDGRHWQPIGSSLAAICRSSHLQTLCSHWPRHIKMPPNGHVQMVQTVQTSQPSTRFYPPAEGLGALRCVYTMEGKGMGGRSQIQSSISRVPPLAWSVLEGLSTGSGAGANRLNIHPSPVRAVAHDSSKGQEKLHSESYKIPTSSSSMAHTALHAERCPWPLQSRVLACLRLRINRRHWHLGTRHVVRLQCDLVLLASMLFLSVPAGQGKMDAPLEIGCLHLLFLGHESMSSVLTNTWSERWHGSWKWSNSSEWWIFFCHRRQGPPGLSVGDWKGAGIGGPANRRSRCPTKSGPGLVRAL